MIALDTNVLARFYVDDPGDPEAAKQRLIARPVITESPSLFVPLTVILELEWVLRAFYGFDATQAIRVFEYLLGLAHINTEEAERVATALPLAAQGMDFADAMNIRNAVRVVRSAGIAILAYLLVPANAGAPEGVPWARIYPRRRSSSTRCGDPVGVNLDRIQIVKDWLDAEGNPTEKVYDVAWSGDRKPDANGKLPSVGGAATNRQLGGRDRTLTSQNSPPVLFEGACWPRRAQSPPINSIPCPHSWWISVAALRLP